VAPKIHVFVTTAVI